MCMLRTENTVTCVYNTENTVTCVLTSALQLSVSVHAVHRKHCNLCIYKLVHYSPVLVCMVSTVNIVTCVLTSTL